MKYFKNIFIFLFALPQYLYESFFETIKNKIVYYLFLGLPLIILFMISIFSIKFLIITAACSIIIFIVVFFSSISDASDRDLLLFSISAILTSAITIYSISTKRLYIKENVKITADVLKYKGYKAQTKDIKKSCKEDVYKIYISKRSLFMSEETKLIIKCQEKPESIQEIK